MRSINKAEAKAKADIQEKGGGASGKTFLSCQALPGSLMSFHGTIGHKGQLGKSLPCPGSMQVQKDTIFLVSLARKCTKCIR